MIAHIKGLLIEKSTSELIIDCNGVGYLLFVSVRTSEKIPEINNEVSLFVRTIVKEDAIDLYGFAEKAEKAAFLKLISVSKIGPKIALGILSATSIAELQNFIVSANHKALGKLPGIGLKTAERIVVELKDKFSDIVIEGETQNFGNYDVTQEALSALIALGYNRIKAEKFVNLAVKETNGQEQRVEKIIKLALKYAIA